MKRLVPDGDGVADEALRAAGRGADGATLGGDLEDVELVDFGRQVAEQRIRDVHAVEQVHVVLPAAAAVKNSLTMFGEIPLIPQAAWNHSVNQERSRSQKNFMTILKLNMIANTAGKLKLKVRV